MEAQKAQKTTTPSPREHQCSKSTSIPKFPEALTELPLRGAHQRPNLYDKSRFTPYHLSPEHALSKPAKAAKDCQVEPLSSFSSYAAWVHEAMGILNQAKQEDVKHKEVFRQLQETIIAFGLYTSPLKSEVRRIEAMMRKHIADVEGCLKVDQAIQNALDG